MVGWRLSPVGLSRIGVSGSILSLRYHCGMQAFGSWAVDWEQGRAMFPSVHPCSFTQSRQPDVRWGGEAAACQLCVCTQDRRAESYGDTELCWWWHSASPAEAGTAHGCVWAAGEVGAVTHPPVEPWSLLNLYFLLCPVYMEGLALPVLSLQMWPKGCKEPLHLQWNSLVTELWGQRRDSTVKLFSSPLLSCATSYFGEKKKKKVIARKEKKMRKMCWACL